jgi:hypothetical protein
MKGSRMAEEQERQAAQLSLAVLAAMIASGLVGHPHRHDELVVISRDAVELARLILEEVQREQ